MGVANRVVGVIQARTGSSRLPGKVLALIEGRPLVLWTIDAMLNVASLDELVLATTTEPSDDELASVAAQRVHVHRGPVHDVLTRCWDAVLPYRPMIVVRQTADNPFVDPDVVEAQIQRLADGGYDFVGNVGWPLGIAAEVARADALALAAAEASDPAEREHVMPFLYARPDRFRIGSLRAPDRQVHQRYTVDTDHDLLLARELARSIDHGPPIHLVELERAMSANPDLAALNASVRQKDWREVDERARGQTG